MSIMSGLEDLCKEKKIASNALARYPIRTRSECQRGGFGEVLASNGRKLKLPHFKHCVHEYL